jgi:hypothetical protein
MAMPGLPDGWEAIWDATAKRPYFSNHHEPYTVQWKKPVLATAHKLNIAAQNLNIVAQQTEPIQPPAAAWTMPTVLRKPGPHQQHCQQQHRWLELLQGLQQQQQQQQQQ